MRRPKNHLPKSRKRDWKAGAKVYLPTEKQIAAACRRIQRHWTEDDPRIIGEKRPTRSAVEPVPMRYLIQAFEDMRAEFAHL